jgi:hypothetical protein
VKSLNKLRQWNWVAIIFYSFCALVFVINYGWDAFGWCAMGIIVLWQLANDLDRKDAHRLKAIREIVYEELRREDWGTIRSTIQEELRRDDHWSIRAIIREELHRKGLRP